MYLTSYNYFLQLITLERRSPYSTNQHKIMMQPADSPRSIANFFTRDGLIQNNNNKKQQQPSPPPLHRIRFDNKVRVLLVPSTKDFTREEIDSIYTTPEDTDDIEDGIIETMLLMRRRMQTTSTSASTPLLSFDDAHEERIEMSHQTSFRGLEHLLHPMGAARQKRGRQLLITSIVERQRTDTSGKRIINADELAMMSQLLSRDAIDRARAKGIEYERAEKKSYAGIFRPTPKLFDEHTNGKKDDACACYEVPTTPSRTYYASSTSSPNLMRSISHKASNAWSSFDSERSMRSLRSYGRRQGTSASSA